MMVIMENNIVFLPPLGCIVFPSYFERMFHFGPQSREEDHWVMCYGQSVRHFADKVIHACFNLHAIANMYIICTYVEV